MVNRALGQRVKELLSIIGKKRYLIDSSEKEKEEVRTAIVAIAEDTGLSITEVVIAMYDGNPKADGLTRVIARLYPEQPDIAVVAYLKGMNGRSRSHALSAYSSELSDRRNLKALEMMYELVPPSQDRANVASSYVKAVAMFQDLTSAITRLRELDLKEEKKMSMADLVPYVRDNQTTLSKDELDQFFLLAREFGMEQSARASAEVAD